MTAAVLRASWPSRVLAVGLAAHLAVLLLAMPLAAQKLPPTVAAIVDFQRILKEAKAARSIDEQIDGRRKAYLDELSREEQRLLEADKQLAKQRSVLAPDVFSQKRKAFEQEVQEAQQLSQERRRQLEGARTTALGEVRRAVVDLMDDLAQARGFNVVLPSSAVLLFSPTIDLTDEVLSQLDQRLPSVAVPEPSE